MTLDPRPILFVISGPSGAGKGTALTWMAKSQAAQRVPTYTTRTPRPTEQDGIEYRFVSKPEFFRLRDEGKLVEYTRTYGSSYYGSPQELLSSLQANPLAVELGPVGFVKVRDMSSRRVIGIFITTKSGTELKSRLIARGEVDGVDERLRLREEFLPWMHLYDYVLFNINRDDFLADLSIIIKCAEISVQPDQERWQDGQ
jgi:guanylate kinase